MVSKTLCTVTPVASMYQYYYTISSLCPSNIIADAISSSSVISSRIPTLSSLSETTLGCISQLSLKGSGEQFYHCSYAVIMSFFTADIAPSSLRLSGWSSMRSYLFDTFFTSNPVANDTVASLTYCAYLSICFCIDSSFSFASVSMFSLWILKISFPIQQSFDLNS